MESHSIIPIQGKTFPGPRFNYKALLSKGIILVSLIFKIIDYLLIRCPHLLKFNLFMNFMILIID